MKPQIFVSSTFYDLKNIRQELSDFIRSFGYKPILFEDGDIGYTPGRELDSACYEAIKNSHMVILIIGSEYGSAASGERKDDFAEYSSVTRNEFRTAVAAGIPIFVMIDKNVMSDYNFYKANIDAIEHEKMKINFPTTKNINIFRFIEEIKNIGNIPIQSFERTSEIKKFIKKQWADMVRNHLNILKDEARRRAAGKTEISQPVTQEYVMAKSQQISSLPDDVEGATVELDDLVEEGIEAIADFVGDIADGVVTFLSDLFE